MKIFSFIQSILDFILKYFKVFVFLLILFFIFGGTNNANIKQPNLVRIDIQGPIMDATNILKQIKEAKEDKNIKGVLLYIDSPGGGLAPSVELSLAIKRLNEAKPVVVYAGGSIASGSYYAAIWSDYIVANPGSFVGSIGVIFQSLNIEELAKKIGVSEQVIAAGDYKQAGTMTREWNNKERGMLENLIKQSYDMFVQDVAQARKLDVEKSDTFAQGQVFMASKAKELRLIDEIGILEDATIKLLAISNIQEPVWKELDPFEKFLNRLANSTTKIVLQNFSGLQAY